MAKDKLIQQTARCLYERQIRLIDLTLDDGGAEGSDRLVYWLVNEKDASRFRTAMRGMGYKRIPHPESRMGGYRFLYQTDEPELHVKEGSFINVYFQLCCKSYFQKAWLPLDKLISDHIWDTAVYDDERGINRLAEDDMFVFVLCMAVFTFRNFGAGRSGYISRRLGLLERPSVIEKLEKEFFSFTPVLIDALQSGRQDDIDMLYGSFDLY